jgi:hypothetical protein
VCACRGKGGKAKDRKGGEEREKTKKKAYKGMKKRREF